MTPFEQELKNALARREPGPDFTKQVLERCGIRDQKPIAEKLRPPRWEVFRTFLLWRMAPVAAALLLVAGGTLYEQHRYQARGIAAKREVLLAMRIAGTKLHEARQHVIDVDGVEEKQ
jgi:hypothetical protein